VKILLLSDTHGECDPLLRTLLQQYADRVQAILHLGDHDYDLLQFAEGLNIPCYTVAGNCDDASLSPRERTIELGGRRIFMAHGNTYHVNTSLARVQVRALACQADICLYGHTHRSYVQQEAGLLVMNPGSLSEPRDNKPPAYGLLTITDEKIAGEIIHL